MFTVLEDWSGRGDLNSRPLAPQASALAGLRYAPTEIGIKPAKILPSDLRLSITKIDGDSILPVFVLVVLLTLKFNLPQQKI